MKGRGKGVRVVTSRKIRGDGEEFRGLADGPEWVERGVGGIMMMRRMVLP